MVNQIPMEILHLFHWCIRISIRIITMLRRQHLRSIRRIFICWWRDEYPEVIHAERAAESDARYHVPSIATEVMVDWVAKLVNNEPAVFYQMDPLSSPHELNPIYSEKTPLLWFTPADMKMFLRPSDESLEDAWRRAMSLLCFAIHILREACEFADFRQTSFGST